MDATSVASAARPFLATFGRLLRCALRRPFLAEPSTWALGLVVALVGLGVAVSLGAPDLVDLALLGAGVVALVALLGWRRLLRSDALPVVYVAELTPQTPGASEASLNHHLAVLKRLQEGPLSDYLFFRRVPAPLREREAGRLLEVSGARGVVFGTVAAAGTAATYRAMLSTPNDWSQDDGQGDHVDESQRQSPKSAQTHKLVPDIKQPLEDLIGERFEAAHVDELEGMLLVRMAEALLHEGDAAGATGCATAADNHRARLTAEAVAHLVVTQARLKYPELSREALLELEAHGNSAADHPSLWVLLAVLAHRVYADEGLGSKDLLRLSEHAVKATPEEPAAHYLLAQALIENGKTGRALSEFEGIADTEEFASDFDFQMTRGALAFNIGRFPQARDAYRRAIELRSTARAHLYLADALYRAGEREASREHYLKALRLQPDLTDAWRGYWWGVEERGPSRAAARLDRLYMLISNRRFIPLKLKLALLYALTRQHYRRHPDQERVHFMLGSQALLRGDVNTAEERLKFAYELTEGVDLEVLGRLVLAYIHQGRLDKAENALRRLRRAPSMQGPGSPPLEEQIERLHYILAPAGDNINLVAGQPGQDLDRLVSRIFPQAHAQLAAQAQTALNTGRAPQQRQQ